MTPPLDPRTFLGYGRSPLGGHPQPPPMPLRKTRNIDGLTPAQQKAARARRQHPNRNHHDEHTRRRHLDWWRQTYGDWCPGAADLNHPPHHSLDLTVDHIHQRRHGGTPHPNNLRVLCRPYNSHRG